MNATEFVQIVRRSVCDPAFQGTLSNLEHPPGRRPPADLVKMSNWYKELDEEQRAILRDIVKSSIESAIFGFFAVLDGVRPVESTSEKGSFELRFVKRGRTDLICPSDAFLHELFK